MPKIKLLCVAIFSAILGGINAQPYFKWHDSIPININGKELTNAWAGGLNFVQLSNIDLNLDGIKDLFIFDRTGNKIRTYLCGSHLDSISFKYAPQYEKKFPKLNQWALLVDYNNDGKEDIFSYSLIESGFDVYQNISNSTNGLQFKKIVEQQKTIPNPHLNPPYNNPSNLYVSSIDVPAITDIDNDGDVDVVTFNIDGIHIEYHKNMSKELGYNYDSLKFERANACWGYATENASTNNFNLFDTCQSNVLNPELTEENTNTRSYNRHSGSCELCLDLNGDGDKELITGDISYKNLTMLTNGGTNKNASFIAKDTAFPANNGGTNSVNLAYFPCGYSIDVNNDTIKDLIVGTNAANASENFNSIVYYKNIGTNKFPIFKYKQSNLLQDNMIDVGEGARPVFFDYDNDGLKDLFVGNNGYYSNTGLKYQIALFKNTGTNTYPKFELVTRDYANLSSLGIQDMVPTFGDLDNDGDADMIIGGYTGKLHYFENTALIGGTANFILKSANLKNSNNRIINVNAYASPQLFDVDKNGTNDLIIGNKSGRIAYYKYSKTIAGVPQFDSISHFWGGVNVKLNGQLNGFSTPCVFKQNDTIKMLVGCETGTVRLYTNINNSGSFKLTDSLFANIDQGEKTTPAVADINNDGLLDLIVGNYQGGLSFYKGTHDANLIDDTDYTIYFDFDAFPNPANNNLTIRISNEYNKNYSFELYNAIGQKVISERITNNLLNVHTENLTQGIYICKVSEIDSKGVPKKKYLTKKIIVAH